MEEKSCLVSAAVISVHKYLSLLLLLLSRALSHIYYFPKCQNQGSWKLLPDSSHEAILDNLQVAEGIERLPTSAVEKCRNLSMAAQEDPSQIRSLLLAYQLETKDCKAMEPFIRCLDQLNSNYENTDDFESLEESRFCEQTLMPYIRFIFPSKEKFKIEGYDISAMYIFMTSY
ncbi:hypothetical protein BDA99DRAFT_201553 [Phascolomyces articulosus]|uniref:Uncharacterized protein n=1 Tax=Phascolomyces articulosus TaxID=60185 RepID=A0AAD5P9U7_9FUNG|nr:hypothetical protein BDA99DRAFT_201553 [Phascolomyces articulosus]